MFVVTHALVPVIAAQATGLAMQAAGRGNPFRRRDHLALMLAGILPDLLSPHISLDDRWSSHTHTLYFLLAWMPAALWCARRLAPRHPRIMAAFLVSAVALHLAGDALSGGIAWLYPWSSGILGGRFISFNSWFAWDAWMAGVAASLAASRWIVDGRTATAWSGEPSAARPDEAD